MCWGDGQTDCLETEQRPLSAAWFVLCRHHVDHNVCGQQRHFDILDIKTSGDFFAFLCSVWESVSASDFARESYMVYVSSLLLAICGTLYFHLLCCHSWFMVCACAFNAFILLKL